MNKKLTGLGYLWLVNVAAACYGNVTEPQALIDHVVQSIENANKGESKLAPGILEIDGMSSPKVRHFLNNVCTLPGTSYFEVGIFKGSTFISAMYQNTDTVENAIAIDNWSPEFGCKKNDFIENSSLYLSPDSFSLYEQDAFKLRKNVFKKPINIYFYDGNHSAEAQERAFIYFDDIFADTFIAIIDDWDYWPEVKDGTRRAFSNLGYKILFEIGLPSSHMSDKENWWNGLYVAVLEKAKK